MNVYVFTLRLIWSSRDSDMYMDTQLMQVNASQKWVFYLFFFCPFSALFDSFSVQKDGKLRGERWGKTRSKRRQVGTRASTVCTPTRHTWLPAQLLRHPGTPVRSGVSRQAQRQAAPRHPPIQQKNGYLPMVWRVGGWELLKGTQSCTIKPLYD